MNETTSCSFHKLILGSIWSSWWCQKKLRWNNPSVLMVFTSMFVHVLLSAVRRGVQRTAGSSGRAAETGGENQRPGSADQHPSGAGNNTPTVPYIFSFYQGFLKNLWLCEKPQWFAPLSCFSLSPQGYQTQITAHWRYRHLCPTRSPLTSIV